MGSIGFAAAARILYGIMKDPNDPDRRLFLPIKNNIAQDKEGFVFNVKYYKLQTNNLDLDISKIEWLDEKITETANEILNSTDKELPPKLEEAKSFLNEMLKSGSVALTKIRQESMNRNISTDRLYKAKTELNIIEEYSIDRKRGKIWMLPV